MKDSRFMSAAEKEKVLWHWERFLKGGMQWKDFTNALYEHLHLHCSFTAHFNKAGFYDTYFRTGAGKNAFLAQFDSRRAETGIPRSTEIGMTYWCSGDYEDINRAMIEVASGYIPMLLLEAEAQQRDSDIALARALLAKHGISLEVDS